MSEPTFLYLHGFASSPRSKKASLLREELRRWGLPLRVPDLNVPSFAELTLSAMVDRVAAEIDACPYGPVHIIASSFGAAAALRVPAVRAADSTVGKLMLLAPSLDFAGNRIRELGSDGIDEWRRKGTHDFLHHHYERTVPVHYRLIEDFERHAAGGFATGVPTLLLHGVHDDVVPWEESVRFAKMHPAITIRVLPTDHAMLDLFDSVWGAVAEFFQLCNLCADPPVSITAYDLELPGEAAKFARHQDEFFAVLSEAYGSSALTTEQFIRRIHSIGHVAYLAFGRNPEKILGGSFIREDGKRGATGVLPDSQGQGIGRRLVCASFDAFAHQFTEVDATNEIMISLLRSCGFAMVAHPPHLQRLLGRTWSRVESYRAEEGRLRYLRASHFDIKVKREFVALARDSLF